MRCILNFLGVVFLSLIANSEIRLSKVNFNCNSKIMSVNISLDDSMDKSVLNFTFYRHITAVKKVFFLSLFVPDDKNDLRFEKLQFQTTVNICGNMKKMHSIASFILDIFKKATNFKFECPAMPGPVNFINITMPDQYIPFTSDLKFRLNITEKNGLQKQRGLTYVWSMEIYGKIKIKKK